MAIGLVGMSSLYTLSAQAAASSALKIKAGQLDPNLELTVSSTSRDGTASDSEAKEFLKQAAPLIAVAIFLFNQSQTLGEIKGDTSNIKDIKTQLSKLSEDVAVLKDRQNRGDASSPMSSRSSAEQKEETEKAVATK